MKKKITSEDLSLDIRNVGKTIESSNPERLINKRDGKRFIETQDECDTYDDCQTNIYCDTAEECETQIDCPVSNKCEVFTEKCADTQSKAELCCPLTALGDQCIINTNQCYETDQCLLTTGSDCNTEAIRCIPTFNNCQPVTQANTCLCANTKDCSDTNYNSCGCL